MFRPNDHVASHVDDYLHELLSSADAAHVEQHCAGCAECRQALDEARKRLRAMQGVPICEASEQLIQTTVAGIDRRDRNRRRLRLLVGGGFLSAVAASIAIIAGLHWHYLSLAASPYDLKVFGQAELLSETDGSLCIRLFDGAGLAMAGIPVEVELLDRTANRAVRLASLATSSQGAVQPRFKLPDWPDGAYDLRITARTPQTPEVLTRPVKLKRSWKVMVTSDKPVYQPGQMIHVRSLALRRPDLKPVAGQKTVFTVTDPKSNIIFKRQDLATSTYGISSIDCPLATEVLEGAYTVSCLVGDSESKLTVEVKKYVLPKFKVDLELDRAYYQPGQTAKGKLHAEYFFGQPVANAKVEVEIQSEGTPGRPGERWQGQTSASGDLEIPVRMPDHLVGRPQHSGDARVHIQATVTDSAGQKQSRGVSRIVTGHPLRVEVIPEGGTLVAGMPNTIWLFASFADGKPAKDQRLAVSVFQSGVGVNQPRPPGLGMDPAIQPGAAPVAPQQAFGEQVVTNELGVASFELAPPPNQPMWDIQVTEAEGKIRARRVSLSCGGVAEDFLVRTDKAVYQGGETLRLTALGGGVEPVFVDFIKDGQTVLTETVAMSNGRGEYSFDLPPDLFGTVELCAYRFNAGGLAIRKSRALYVRPARGLTIKPTLDHSEYRPGQRARVRFELKDANGQPVAGALSLAAVDEAVFSVLSQTPGLESRFYMLEQELLRPIWTIYPWSPEQPISAPVVERNRFEQALFARTSQVTEGSREPPAAGRWQGRRGGAIGMVAPAPEPAIDMIREDAGAAPGAAPAIPRGSPHSLAVSSLPIKQQDVEDRRERGLECITWAWAGLVVFLLGAGYVSLWLFVRPLYVLILHGVGAIFLFMVVVPVAFFFTLAIGGGAGSTFRTVGMMAPLAEAMDQAMAMEKSDLGMEPMAPGGAKAVPARVRERFVETLFWRPELITDEAGRASLDLELADSITTWRLTTSAVSADGRLGADQTGIKVFQPFFVDINLPVALTRGDEVAVPVVLYNYLDKAQTVELKLADRAWFKLLEDPQKTIELKPREVVSSSYRFQVTRVGNHDLQVDARGSELADAIKRQIEVVPDGLRVEEVKNGTLQQPIDVTLAIPDSAIEGSPRAIVKIYPSNFSQLVEGLDSIFQMPYGCFEQTSSTTYPNILALDYLRRINKSAPEVEAKARQYLHLGYQRLVSFEVIGGGFEWFGHPPANRRLTAYGLMEFQDMARVHDVDPRLIERTRRWLLNQRNVDGSWSESPGLHAENDPTRGPQGSELARLSITAYIAWAVFANQAEPAQARATWKYLTSHKPETIDDPYVLALVANALTAIDPKSPEVTPYLDRLDALKKASDDAKQVWWEQVLNSRTAFYGAGRSGSIETTALAALAMISAGHNPATTRGALTWLVQQKDSRGNWHSTQATVLALKALLAGTGSLGADQERRIEIAVGGQVVEKVVIPADQADVMKQLDLTAHLRTGANRLSLTESSNTAAGFQVAFRYHVPADPRQRQEPLTIDLVYDRTELRVNDRVQATATIANQSPLAAPMVMLDLPIPPGFSVASEDLMTLVANGTIARFQLTPRQIIVYLRGLQPGQPLRLSYGLRATMPVKATVPPARIYEYYDPDRKGMSPSTRLTVLDRR